MSFPATTPAPAPSGDIPSMGGTPNEQAKNTLWYVAEVVALAMDPT